MAEWNTRPGEDVLRADLAEASALIAKYAEADRYYYYHDESEYSSDRLNEASVALLDYAEAHP